MVANLGWYIPPTPSPRKISLRRDVVDVYVDGSVGFHEIRFLHVSKNSKVEKDEVSDGQQETVYVFQFFSVYKSQFKFFCAKYKRERSKNRPFNIIQILYCGPKVYWHHDTELGINFFLLQIRNIVSNLLSHTFSDLQNC